MPHMDRRLLHVRRLIWETVLLALLSGMLLGSLASCSQDSARPPVAQATSTATAAPPTAVQATATPAVTPTSTPVSHTLSVAFSVTITVVACSGAQPAGTLCVHVTGSGTSSALGKLSVERTAVLSPPGDDSCGPSTTTGKLTTASGDSATFRATGQFCRATSTATYTFTITGGTGRYHSATGSGSVQVPRLLDSNPPRETWNGTLVP